MVQRTSQSWKTNRLRLFLVKSFRALRRPEYLGALGECRNSISQVASEVTRVSGVAMEEPACEPAPKLTSLTGFKQ